MISKNRWINHGIHFPLRAINARLERIVLKGTVLFALSDRGADALRKSFPECEVVSSRHFIPPRPAISPATDRPQAVGLFGHAYKGKGFDRLQSLRCALPDSIDIRVAGRGTERLAGIPGVTILGSVDGLQEDEFFASVRAILLPYANTSRYGEILSVSGVAARAFAYGTPVIASDSGTLTEAAEEGGLVTAPNDVESLAALTFETTTSDAELERLGEETLLLRDSRTVEDTVSRFAEYWGKVVSPESA
ncbi:glycosyltransferase [bacterium RCC_150]